MELAYAIKVLKRRANHLEQKSHSGSHSEKSKEWMRLEVAAIRRVIEELEIACNPLGLPQADQ